MQSAELSLFTGKRTEFYSITSQLNDKLRQCGWKNGVLTVFSPHTTAAITINENADPDVAADMDMFLSRLVPKDRSFRHMEGNSDAHLKASLIGSSVQIIVRDSRMWLGQWQGVYFCEFDGPRSRQLCLAFSE